MISVDQLLVDLSPVFVFVGLPGLIIGGTPEFLRGRRFRAYVGAIMGGIFSIIFFIIYVWLFEYQFWPDIPSCAFTINLFLETCRDDFLCVHSSEHLFIIVLIIIAGGSLGGLLGGKIGLGKVK